jgi:type IV pilus assembly protein PilM
MAATRSPILGIDLNQYEIRVVELRGTWTSAQVVRAAAAPMPRGAFEGDRILHPDVVAQTLKGLLHRMNASTRAAVIGIASRSAITRVLDLPRVTEQEMRMVIQGELAHYQILREETGVFDYMRLQEPESGSEGSLQALVVAAEERVLSSYREIADRAGLQLIALEPILIAMYRAAYPQTQAQPSALCLSISYGKSEVAIVDRGQVRLYRRIDLGSDDLIGGRQGSRSGGRSGELPLGERMLLATHESEAPDEESVPETGGLLNAAAAALATEIQRSIDYYRREFPRAPAVSRIILATHDPQLEPLAAWLNQALQTDVLLSEPPIAVGTTRSVAAQLEAPDGLRFLGAAGLAMRTLPGQPALIPSFNLTAPADAFDPDALRRRRVMTVSLLLSALILAAGAIAALSLSRTVGQMEHIVAHTQSVLLGRQQTEQRRLQEIQNQMDQLQMLKREGFPFPRIMDSVAGAIDPMAGITDVSLDRNGRLAVVGEASTQMAMIKTLQGMQFSPYFMNTNLEGYSSRTVHNGQVVEFRITSQLIGTTPAAAP